MGTFRENLREELDYQDISVKELAAKTGISKRTIENYLSSRGSIPPADYACKIANLLDVPVEWLVTGINASVLTDDSDNVAMNDEAKELIDDFHCLSPEVQSSLKVMIHAAAEDARSKKKSNSKRAKSNLSK